MERPSAFWNTVEEHEANRTHTCAFWRVVPLDALERLATRLRSVECRVNRERYAQGSSAVVIELAYDDNEIWVARLTAPVNVCGDSMAPDAIARQINCEIATLKLVRERTSVPVPVVHAYSSGSDNELGIPYVIMSAVGGADPERLGISSYLPHVREQDLPRLNRYLASLADCFLQLNTIRFDRIGSIYLDPSDNSKYVIGPLALSGLGPFDTAWEFYTARAEHLEEKVLSFPDDSPEQREGRALVLWLYRLGIGLLENSPNNKGPFLFAHNDVSSDNTLTNENGEIVGIVDWAQAIASPVECFATQVWQFTCNQAWNDAAGLASHRMFSSAIEALEDTVPYQNNVLPDGKRLSEWHSSPLAYLVGHIFLLMNGPDHCNGDGYVPILAKYVLGAEDLSCLKNSVIFKEWYATTMKRVNSRHD